MSQICDCRHVSVKSSSSLLLTVENEASNPQWENILKASNPGLALIWIDVDECNYY